MYYNSNETNKRIAKVRGILRANHLDAALIYFDELNVANGWYLSGWCGQFEKGSVLVPVSGEPWLLGGPESEPFAKQSSSIKNIRSFPVFMVPEEEYPNAEIISFAQLNEELKAAGTIVRRLGIVGTNSIPRQVYIDLTNGFEGVEIVGCGLGGKVAGEQVVAGIAGGNFLQLALFALSFNINIEYNFHIVISFQEK